MVEEGLSEKDKELVEQLRADVKKMLPAAYDTDFNLLRWITAYDYDMKTARVRLKRHLKFRALLDLDGTLDTPALCDSEVYQKYIPVGVIGPAGNGNKILLFELAGRADPDGLVNSVQTSGFMTHRFRLLEKVQRMMLEVEKKTNQQSGLIYVYDLEGLTLDSGLLNIVTGPLRIMWAQIYDNYPEMMYRIIVINVPTFMNVIWKAFSPFVPENTKHKVKFLGANWKEELLEYVSADCLPVFWGGTLKDKNGDEMCQQMIPMPPGKIPPELYWKPKQGDPTIDDLTMVTVYAGAKCFVGFHVANPDTIMEWFIQSDQEFTFGVYYADDPKSTELRSVFLDNSYPGMAPMDNFRLTCKKAGVYHLKFGNEGAWFMSVTPKYFVRFWDKEGTAVEAVQISSS